MAKGSMKARGLKGGNAGEGSTIDWKAIHDQVEEGTQSARISVIVDLGMHTEELALGDKGQTGFLTEEDYDQWVEEMKKKYGAKHSVFKSGDPEMEDADEVEVGKYTKTIQLEDDGTWTVVDEAPVYVVQANEYGGEREYQELAMFADLVENTVDYGEEIGEKAFRVMLNRRWMGNINGFQLKKSKPAQQGGVWTIKGNTKLAELATATGHKDLLECDLEEADWSEMLGEAFNITIEKSGDEDQYLNIGKCVGLKKKKGVLEEVEELEQEAVLITFDDVTVEDLEAAHIRGDIIKKIKQATDYKGSQMEDAITEFEARQKAKFAAKKDAKNDDNDEDEDEQEDKQTRKVTKVTKGKAESTTKKTTKATKKDEGDSKPVDNSGNDDDEKDWDE